MPDNQYDVIIIGAGPAGLTAGIYAARSNLKTLIMEKSMAGGQLMVIDLIENYPGFEDAVSGFDLVEKMKKQAERFGAGFLDEEAADVDTDNLVVSTSAGEKYSAGAIIIATGARPTKLGVKGEAELLGRGVSYCATCDGPLFKNKEVVVVGGGNAAVGEAIYLTRFAGKVTLIHRRDQLRAAAILQERAQKNDKIDIKWSSVVVEILGGDRVSGVRIKNLKTLEESDISAEGVFLYVGVEPYSGFLHKKIDTDDKGFIITDEEMRTSSRGIFACGDVRKKSLKQIITACSEGAIAAFSCQHFIEENS
ncbi:MAG: thioredoxin-disulfide reductase [Candidatus Omnitrophota bacterium]